MGLINKLKNMDVIDVILSKLHGGLFVKVSTVFIGIFISFFLIICTFFSVQQIRYLKNSLINEGKSLVSALAINSRLGVLAGNEQMLRDEAAGFLYQPDVAGISIFDRDVALMNIKKKGKEQMAARLASILDIKSRMKKGESPPFIYEDKKRVDIWVPVFVSMEFKDEEEMMLGITPKEKRLVGWVELILDKSDILRKERIYIICSFSLFFFCITWAYYLMRRASLKIVGPLDRMCNMVRGFTTIEDLYEIPVERTHDEAGKLASAFNELVRTLKKREEEKKRLEQQLLNAQKLEAIGSLSSGIAHDFNNVLSSIMGGADMIKYHLERGEEIGLSTADVILMSCVRAREMIARLLTYTKGKEVERRPLKLNDQVLMLKKLVAGIISDDIEVKLNLTSDDPVIFANATQLYQVLMNMVTNAQDAMPLGGTLKISTEVVEISETEAKRRGSQINPGRYAVISMEDTGIGMDEETKEKIFEPFFTTKSMDKGTGLGLYNSYSIIKDHDGFIDVISSPDKGTTFKIYLPVTDAKEAVMEKDEESLKDLPRGSGTILVADDDIFVRGVLKELLTEFGYNVILAINGVDVIKKFKENLDKIDLLLIDIVMPYKHGKAAHDEIKRIKPGIKIIFMSGYPEYVLAEKGISTSDIDCLEKPIRSAVLIKKIQQVMSS